MTKEEFLARLIKEKEEIEALMAHYGRKTDGGEWVNVIDEDENDFSGDEADQAEHFEKELKDASILASLEERLEQINTRIEEFKSSAIK